MLEDLGAEVEEGESPVWFDIDVVGILGWEARNGEGGVVDVGEMNSGESGRERGGGLG